MSAIGNEGSRQQNQAYSSPSKWVSYISCVVKNKSDEAQHHTYEAMHGM